MKKVIYQVPYIWCQSISPHGIKHVKGSCESQHAWKAPNHWHLILSLEIGTWHKDMKLTESLFLVSNDFTVSFITFNTPLKHSWYWQNNPTNEFFTNSSSNGNIFRVKNWPFVRGIHRSSVNSPLKGQWRGALMFSLICVWINGWVTNREAGDLRRHRAHYDVIVMNAV